MKKITIFIVGIISAISVSAQNEVKSPNYPTPNVSYKHLFYLQHSLSRNAVIFEAQFDASGMLRKDEPVTAYWIMFEKGRKKEALTKIEKKLAFGTNSYELHHTFFDFEVKLNAYKDKPIYLRQISPFKAEAYMNIDHETVKLDHVFVRANFSGFFLHVEAIELFGQNDDKNLKKYACIDVAKR